MRVFHKESGYQLAERVFHASTFFQRLKGLMFEKSFGDKDGVMLDPCNSIHNFFVKFPIDVIFLDKKNRIVKIIRGFKPWRISFIYLRSKKVLELPLGTIPMYVKEGDSVEVVDV